MEAEKVLKEMTEEAKKKYVDVVTLAQECRDGEATVGIHPANNGFFVMVELPGVRYTYIFSKPRDVGLFMQSLFNADLGNPAVLARLRRLTGQI